MPSLTKQDISALKNFTEEFNRQKAQKNFYSLLSEITCEELFDSSEKFSTKNGCLNYMCDILFQMGYVNSNYRTEIMEREALSSTALGNFAIPHALKMNAYKTGIFILIPEAPIP